MEGRIWEIGKFWVWNGRMMGWWMTIVVMMTLVRWDDRGEEVNQGNTGPFSYCDCFLSAVVKLKECPFVTNVSEFVADCTSSSAVVPFSCVSACFWSAAVAVLYYWLAAYSCVSWYSVAWCRTMHQWMVGRHQLSPAMLPGHISSHGLR